VDLLSSFGLSNRNLCAIVAPSIGNGAMLFICGGRFLGDWARKSFCEAAFWALANRRLVQVLSLRGCFLGGWFKLSVSALQVLSTIAEFLIGDWTGVSFCRAVFWRGWAGKSFCEAACQAILSD
jgi:hypothetical protein